jgi:thiol-disulfide isomerase/thioredoxin
MDRGHAGPTDVRLFSAAARRAREAPQPHFPFLAALLLLLAAAPAGPDIPVVKTVDAVLELTPPGQLRVLHFWATWCGACTRDAPNVRELAGKLDAAGIPFIGVSLDQPGKAAAVAASVRDQKFFFPNAILDSPDPTPIVARLDPKWDADLPATFLVAKSGKTLHSYLGQTPVDRIVDDIRRETHKL